MKVQWDTKTTTVTTPQFRAVIRSGISVLASNAFTALAMTAPVAKQRLWEAMLALAGDLGNVVDSGALDAVGVPAYRFLDGYGMRLAIGYSFVPSGVRQRGQIHGEFRLVLMTRDDVPESLTDVFGLESLWKEIEPCSIPSRTPSATRSSKQKQTSTRTSLSVAPT